jgi:fructose-bisphosphate aldolase class I
MERESMNKEQLDKIRSGQGFIAALDQSGGSTPKALKIYGIGEDAYSNDDEMFRVMHEMRSRIMTSPAFNGDRILAAILFEDTMNRDIDGKPSAEYLWNVKNVVPIIKIDKGLADEADAAQVMKPMPGLDDLLKRAGGKGFFGTKERSVIADANEKGVKAVADQQFEIGKQVAAAGLVPILEPEISIKAPNKPEAEALLKKQLLAGLEDWPSDKYLMFKLTLPEEDNFYSDLVDHPNVVRVVALSGGYSREEANSRLSRNKGVVASFSRALTEGLSAQQSDEEFNKTLDASIQSIYDASNA